MRVKNPKTCLRQQASHVSLTRALREHKAFRNEHLPPITMITCEDFLFLRRRYDCMDTGSLLWAAVVRYGPTAVRLHRPVCDARYHPHEARTSRLE